MELVHASTSVAHHNTIGGASSTRECHNVRPTAFFNVGEVQKESRESHPTWPRCHLWEEIVVRSVVLSVFVLEHLKALLVYGRDVHCCGHALFYALHQHVGVVVWRDEPCCA
jgi:hypothetical protein